MFNEIVLTLALLEKSAFAAGPFAKDPRVMACLDKRHLPADKVDPVYNSSFDSAGKSAPACAQGKMADLKRALQNQIAACRKPGAETQGFRFGCREVKMQTYCIEAGEALLRLANSYGDDLAGLTKKVWETFDLYRVDAKTGKMMFTGYNAPLGSEIQAFEDLNAIPANQEPMVLLGPPRNLVRIKDSVADNCGFERHSGRPIKWCLHEAGGYRQLPTSEAIRAGALDGQAPVLGYMSLKNYMYLALEGAGQILYTHDNGRDEHIIANYGGTNGRQGNLLTSIVTCMKSVYGDAKPPTKTSEAYLRWLGVALGDAIKYNESHTFWNLGGSDYLGVDEIPLIRDHVMATDPTVIPTGAVSLIQPAKTNGPCALLMTASDIGSAIKGARGDLYMGVGPDAVKRSNKITGTGEAYMLLPKGAGTPIPGCKN